jgi:hypothetical protein
MFLRTFVLRFSTSLPKTSIKQRNKIVYVFFLVDIYKDFYKIFENLEYLYVKIYKYTHTFL